jgi:hypothetical protein
MAHYIGSKKIGIKHYPTFSRNRYINVKFTTSKVARKLRLKVKRRRK